MPQGQKSPVPEKQELHQFSRMERRSQGVEAWRGRDVPRLPGTLREELHHGESMPHPVAEQPKGLQGSPLSPGSNSDCSGRVSPWRELHSQEHYSLAQAQEHRVPGDTAQVLTLPPGQAEARKAQDSKDPPATRWP